MKNFSEVPRQSTNFNTTSNKIYTYFIASHGAIVQMKDSGVAKIAAIKIPPKVELITYTNLGTFAWHAHTCTPDYVCKKNIQQPDVVFETPALPYFKYTQQFPELELTPDNPDKHKPLPFYSGIIHCIPKDRDSDSNKTQEIIHNMDADPFIGRCSDHSIYPHYYNTKKTGYDSDKNYSAYYKKVLDKNDKPHREPPLNSIKKCGEILLSEAIKIIQQHCEATYTDDYTESTIQIHISGCLTLNEPSIRYNKKFYEVFDRRVSNRTSLRSPTTSNFMFLRNGIEFLITIDKNPDTGPEDALTPRAIEKSVYYDITESLYEALIDTIGTSIDEMKVLPKNIKIHIPQHVITSSRQSIEEYLKRQLKLIRRVQPVPLPPPTLNTPAIEYKINDRVMVKPSNGNWTQGTVTSTKPLMVKPDLWKKSHIFELIQVRPLPPAPPLPEAPPPPPSQSSPPSQPAIEYKENDRVQVRDRSDAPGKWRNGKVTSAEPLMVKPDRWKESFAFDHVRHMPPSLISRLTGPAITTLESVKRMVSNVSQKTIPSIRVGGKRKKSRKQTRKRRRKSTQHK